MKVFGTTCNIQAENKTRIVDLVREAEIAVLPWSFPGNGPVVDPAYNPDVLVHKGNPSMDKKQLAINALSCFGLVKLGSNPDRSLAGHRTTAILL